MLRAIVIAVFALVVTTSSAAQEGKTLSVGGGSRAGGSKGKATSSGVLSARSASKPPSLYAWANPLNPPMKWADHTWVSSYPVPTPCPGPAKDYWYATGACHPAGKDAPPRALASAPADMKLARCIAAPNISTFNAGPATARIRYGIDGVCHQIANRILFATAAQGRKPVTTEKARGYRVSRFVWGTYGTDAQWKQLQKLCAVSKPVSITPEQELAAMIDETFGRELLGAKRSSLGVEHARLQSRISALDSAASARNTAPEEVAAQINGEINASLRRLEESLGRTDFERFFDWPAGQEIVLVSVQGR